MSRNTTIPHLARAIAERQNTHLHRIGRARNYVSCARTLSAQPNLTAKTPPPLNSGRQRKNEKDWPAQIAQIEDPQKARKVSRFFKISSAFAFSIGLYCTYLYTQWTNSVASHANSGDYLPFNADVSSRWKELGRDFDDEVEMSEKLMSMRKKRGRLVRRAYGNVLEVSVGTGRNLDYYNLHGFNPLKPARRNIITHLTLNDQSDVIIAAAERKLDKMISRQENSTVPSARVEFVVGDAGVAGIIKRPEGGFDTIIQTMGVCSMVDPVGFLKRMGRLCRQPGEKSASPERWRAEDDDGKGGQILLLEHGRGHYDWLNWILDTGASLHAHRFGCWWNKDIEQIVKQSGLEIETVKRYHGGTTWMIVLRPVVQDDAKRTDPKAENLRVIPARLFGQSGR